ncbi:class C beta-lactamase-related serine hydrolase [Paraflavitalea soli]|uniref:Class C beta-lactamase-related serine hydrolase n=1 Tax=Paraflavitalea soli TaxID=2315862 RepID=A0A3B7MX92_9BACT|nr:serine hydrolase [Paraflavitalea soli]AXY74971.1 class C beta-lactamase-related serine hydrolase [Paraflavitalea soli]
MRLQVFVFLLLQLTVLKLDAQQSLFVKDQGITSRVHQDNMGKIIFTSRDIALTELTEKDFLSNYQLTNKSNLFITVFMPHSLTNYMHQLAPALTADSLVKVGNYQFALLVDNNLVYRSNLMPGAPYAQIQDTVTAFCKPLINDKGSLWSQSYWGRFMRNGGDSALTEGKHVLSMEIRPYVQLAGKTVVGDIIAAGTLPMQVYRKPRIDITRIRLNKIRPYDGFDVSKEKIDSNKIKTLIGNINEGVFKGINGIVVIDKGKLLIEEYFNGEDRSNLHDPRSVGKTFASTITGIAIEEGYLKNEQQQLKEFYNLRSFANYAIQKEEVAIKDLLTMSSVFDGDDNTDSPGNEENMYPTDNWVKFTLDLPVNLERPKEQWHYFTAGVMLLGDILHKTVPGGLEKYADEKLFKPLHITHYQWQYTPQHVANTAGGIQLCALDFAKYGQLYKNEGKWQGKQIIPREWVHKSFTKQRVLPNASDEYYGYLFWNKKYTVGGKSYEAFYCTGNGGNKIFVFKDQPWVIVITASAYGQPYAHPQVDKMMAEYILPAIINKDQQ